MDKHVIYKGTHWFDPRTTQRINRQPDDLTEVLCAIDGGGSIGEVFATLLDFLPVDRFPFVTLTKMGPRHQPIASSFPKDWSEEYLTNSYWRDDPVLAAVLSHIVEFAWDDVTSGLRGNARKVMSAAAEQGLRDGLSIPYHGPYQHHAAISLCGPNGATQMDQRERARMLAVIRAVHARFADFEMKAIAPMSGTARLTSREIECLRWVQLGKTDREISRILAIEPNTATDYVRGAMKKLGSATRANAVAVALAHGILGLTPWRYAMAEE